MIARSLFAGLLALLPMSGWALTPLPPCGWNVAEQRFLEGGGGIDVFVTSAGNGFVQGSFRGPDAQHWGLLQHCKTGKYILFVAESRNEASVFNRFQALIETTIPVTMDEIATDLATLGAGVRRGAGDIGTCGCDAVGLNG